MADISDIPGIDLEDPLVKRLRKELLEEAAQKQDSDLHCPYCKTNLHYNGMTVGKECSGKIDAGGRPVIQTIYSCPLCDKDFNKL